MADPAVAADPTPASKTSWPDVAMTALHYAAGGALLGGAGYMTMQKVMDGQLFAGLLVAAAGAIGFKMKS